MTNQGILGASTVPLSLYDEANIKLSACTMSLAIIEPKVSSRVKVLVITHNADEESIYIPVPSYIFSRIENMIAYGLGHSSMEGLPTCSP